jgi:hypothetical protein
MNESLLRWTGVDGATGAPLLPPMPAAVVARAVLARGTEHLDLHRAGPPPWIDPLDLASAGWGVVLPRGAGPEVRAALEPLLALRRSQASEVREDRYREIAGQEGYRPGETKRELLARHGRGPGPAEPSRLPYYLLLVGGPETIPFSFQHQLSLQHAVGRLALSRPEEIAAYAAQAVAADRGSRDAPDRPRRAVFFQVSHPGDAPTEDVSRYLIEPLLGSLRGAETSWEITTHRGRDASRKRLLSLLGGEETPRLLFTSGHGLGFPATDRRQRQLQGALLCGDWTGPGVGAEAPARGHLVAAEDLPAEADLRGLIAVLLACHSAGTPRLDSFPHEGGNPPKELAAEAFVAALPQRLLSHPRGALAVVGHVDRVRGYSFYWPGAGGQHQTFEALLGRLLAGWPVGAAFLHLADRYAELATDLAAELDRARRGEPPDEQAIAELWTATHDARGYLILGDPAVHLSKV